jgi:hypothetical protein
MANQKQARRFRRITHRGCQEVLRTCDYPEPAHTHHGFPVPTRLGRPERFPAHHGYTATPGLLAPTRATRPHRGFPGPLLLTRPSSAARTHRC